MKVEYRENNDLAIFNGYTFRRDKKTGYYLSSSVIDGKRRRLHVYVWESAYGKVPKGFQIHHVDEDKYHNDLDNLVRISRSRHMSFHGKENAQTIGYDEMARRMSRIAEKAKEWHASEEGIEWHKKQYERTKDKLQAKKIFTCVVCGNEFTSIYHGRNRFCSNKCKSKYRRMTGADNIECKCAYCGKTFTKNKYSKTKTCCKKCAAVLRWNK